MSAPEGSAKGGQAPAGIDRWAASNTPLVVRAAIHPNGRRVIPDLARLGEVVLPADQNAPGAARIVVEHCLAGLAAPRVVDDAKLLASELVTNSLQHADLRDDDLVRVRVDLGAEALRVEIENPGTAGTVGVRSPDARTGGFGLQLVEDLAACWGVARTHSTTVWFESART
jgi:anti-sigma regulatory factor (Ser/Thr protein kinase)